MTAAPGPATATAGVRAAAGGRRSLLVMSAGRIYGGAERSLTSTAVRLPELGWDVTLTCPEGPLAEEARRLGIPVVAQPWRTVRQISDKSSGRKRYSPAAIAAALGSTGGNALRLARLARARRPDVLLSNSLPSHLVTALAGRLAGVPTVWYLRDIVDPGPGRRVLELGGRPVAGMIAISDAVAGSLVHPRVRVVPEPIDPPPPGVRPLQAGDGTRPVLGYLGRLDPRKGIEDLLRAAGRVDVDVVLAGEPLLAPAGYVDSLRALAERTAPGRVRFLGAVPTPWPLLAAVDVLVVPSLREPWGRVAAEGLIAGVPVVAAATGGLPEIVRDGVDGYLYPSGEVDVLVDRLRRLLDDPARRSAFRAAALAGAHRFDPAVNAAGVAAELDGVLDAVTSRSRR